MTINEMLKALPVLQRVVNFQLAPKKAYEVLSLAKKINEKRAFFIKEERKLIEKFNAEMDETGAYVFPTEEECLAFSEAAEEMMEMDAGIQKIDLSFEDFSENTMSPAELATLECIINFQ